MNTLSKSWDLCVRAFRVVEQDKEMLLYPLISALLASAWLGPLAFLLWLVAQTGTGTAAELLEYPLVFAMLLGVAFFSSYARYCITYTTKVRFEGGDAGFVETLGAALGATWRLLAWAGARATVGLVLHVIESAAERLGEMGQGLVRLLERSLDGLWKLSARFVVPAMVYEGFGPKRAFETSAGLLRETWGHSLAARVHFGLLRVMFLFGWMSLVFGLSLLAPYHPLAWVISTVVGVLGCGLIVTFFQVAAGVYDTALYVYATERRVVPGFTDEQIAAGFRNAF